MHKQFTSIRAAKPAFLLFSICFLIGQAAFLRAQQNAADEIETLLETPAVTYGQAARFVLEASDTAFLSGREEAFVYAMEKNWLPKNASADGEARLDGISMLIMHSFNLKGGIFYSLTKNPHFSYRELTYKSMIQGRTDPAMKTPGRTLLFIVGRVLSQTGIEAQPTDSSEDEILAQNTARLVALADSINDQLKALSVSDAAVRVTGEGITISLSNIQFLADSAVLPDSEKEKLDDIAYILGAIQEKRILVSGHTAMAGTEEGRLEISRERAQSVASYLISTGVRETGDVSVAGYGATRPIADNDTPEGMAANRRVEITILDQ